MKMSTLSHDVEQASAGVSTMTNRQIVSETLQASGIALLTEAVAVGLIFAAAFVWLGILSGRI